ncbi:MAG: methyltransferase domain-containing protein [Eubacteriales bacterium]|nr:methyltransferase domain-containing protein [Eubacteriales bacterium]
MKPFWESEYLNKNRATFGNPSKEVAELAAQLPEGARVLDVGCGDGRHALYLAGLGFRVDAFDISENAIHKLNALKQDAGLQINACVCDVLHYDFRVPYDLIIVHGVLQFIERAQQPAIIELLKTWTAAGGYHIIALFTDEEPVPDDLKDVMVGVFKNGEIAEYYDDWEIKMFENSRFSDEHENGIRHRHAMNKLIAQKPRP